MVDDLSGAGDVDVVAVGEEGAVGFVLLLLVAEVLEVDGRRFGNDGRGGDGGTRTGGGCVARALEGSGDRDGRRFGGEDVAAGAFVARSGTTLVEQVLASHAAVFGAGERRELPEAVTRLGARLGALPFPESIWTIPNTELRQIGTTYASALHSLAPEASRIVDKMPLNFAYCGLIHLILPNARIIHVVRDPVDTCLSCFSKLFSGEQPFAYDLAELGRFYRPYQKLMAHWRAVLPPSALLEVRYERVVDDLATEARRIVAHCGLDWDESYLEFHKTTRPVHTASVTQVRQPIYRSSIGRWRPDAALLQPLLAALGDDGAREAV